MILKSDVLELRCVVNRQSAKTGNIYYIVHCEQEDGSPIQFYVRNDNVFADGLHKGDKVVLSCSYVKYKDGERLSVVRIDKVV